MAGAPRLPAARLRRAPPRPRPARRRQRRAGRGHAARGPRGGARRSSTAASSAAPSCNRRRRRAGRRPGRVHDRRRRRQQPVRAGARHVPHPGVAVRHGDPHVLGVAAPRRPVDRVGARRQGPQRQPDARLRLDLPGRRRHREHRRRPAVDVPRLQERQHDPPARRLRPPDRRPLGDRRRPAGVPARSAGASRWAARSGPRPGPTYLVVGDAAGSVNPFNGEGIDYAYETARMAADVRPRGAGRRRPDGAAALPEAARRRVRRSTSRSPGCSPG